MLACSGADVPAERPRVDSVAAAPPVDARRIEGFCDVVHPAATAPPLQPLPTLAPWPAAKEPQWINVWATWCGPCVAEMPMLARWEDRLEAQGIRVDLVFVSMDEREELVTRFQQRHPEFGVGDLRVPGAAALAPWLLAMALDGGTALPLHLFVDAEGRMRCARSGAIDPGDFEVVRALFTP